MIVTWFSSDLSIASRLDSFLISRHLCDHVVFCEIRPCVYSDHDFVFIELNLHSISQRGPGVWKFNNSLLRDETFCSAISDLICQFLRFRSSFSLDLVMWDRLKHDIKCFAIKYSRERWKQLSRKKISTINQISFLKRCLASCCEDVKAEIRELESFLKHLFEQQLEGSKIRSPVKWLEEGETPSSFFLRLENERHAKTIVSSVFNPSGIEVSSLPEMIEAHEAFYSNLFSCQNIDLPLQRDLFTYVTSRLSESEQSSCEGPLTLAEVTEALRHSNRNKSPGADGLTVEFYSHFWDRLAEPLVAVFNQSLERGELPESMKASVTRLIHKKDDKRLLKNWRPISLLNVDYKICSKAVSLRLARVLCVEVLACKIRASRDIEGFLLPGAGGLQFKVKQMIPQRL